MYSLFPHSHLFRYSVGLVPTSILWGTIHTWRQHHNNFCGGKWAGSIASLAFGGTRCPNQPMPTLVLTFILGHLPRDMGGRQIWHTTVVSKIDRWIDWVMVCVCAGVCVLLVCVDRANRFDQWKDVGGSG